LRIYERQDQFTRGKNVVFFTRVDGHDVIVLKVNCFPSDQSLPAISTAARERYTERTMGYTVASKAREGVDIAIRRAVVAAEVTRADTSGRPFRRQSFIRGAWDHIFYGGKKLKRDEPAPFWPAHRDFWDTLITNIACISKTTPKMKNHHNFICYIINAYHTHYSATEVRSKSLIAKGGGRERDNQFHRHSAAVDRIVFTSVYSRFDGSIRFFYGFFPISFSIIVEGGLFSPPPLYIFILLHSWM